MEEIYGLFGGSSVIRDNDEYVERLVIFQESGLYVGAAPSEMRITDFVPFDDINFGRQWCAKLNRKANLPYYLGKVKIKTIDYGNKIMDEDLAQFNLKPLENLKEE